MNRQILLFIAAGVAALAAPAGAGDPTPAEQAVLHYDQERYEEACAILKTLDGESDLAGPLLYRLSFCLRTLGDREGERAALQRSVAALEKEVPGAGSLEPAFYLANAHRNLNQVAEARKVAREATGRVDSGDWSVSDDPVERFRLGKLYADQGLRDPASLWYGKALEALSPSSHPAYVRWARRYLGQLAFEKARFEDAESQYAALVGAGGASPADHDSLAVARTRLKKWTGAREAWQAAEKASEPANRNRPRYCWRLAGMAESLGTLPDLSPSGRPWNGLSRAELESLMKEQAVRLREIQSEAVEPKGGEAELAAAREQVAAVKSVFVAAALEYAARRHPIRETAFSGGYAPLIFKPELWKVPPG